MERELSSEEQLPHRADFLLPKKIDTTKETKVVPDEIKFDAKTIETLFADINMQMTTIEEDAKKTGSSNLGVYRKCKQQLLRCKDMISRKGPNDDIVAIQSQFEELNKRVSDYENKVLR